MDCDSTNTALRRGNRMDVSRLRTGSLVQYDITEYDSHPPLLLYD